MLAHFCKLYFHSWLPLYSYFVFWSVLAITDEYADFWETEYRYRLSELIKYCRVVYRAAAMGIGGEAIAVSIGIRASCISIRYRSITSTGHTVRHQKTLWRWNAHTCRKWDSPCTSKSSMHGYTACVILATWCRKLISKCRNAIAPEKN